ncbi:hypothetical protein BDV95DRAFT_622372 [Massariosphaeria phaeospora]|uniref:Uncharacterized protein n=1 Tax=Massariosphaeria phaeospora TaxID=100035 RepID=A0A7C8M3H8_9PLEO|nr:hypothetical protein BDV95DRAFT_622372 [Massariosphaeria phaeospora]
MSSNSRLLSLPRELRDSIYEYYFAEKGGYHYDFDTGKLKKPINLALIEARAVLQDAAWQEALDESYNQGILPTPSPSERRQHRCYKFEGFPQAIRDIIAGTSIISCNFPIDDFWDVQQLVEEHRGWNLQDWDRASRAYFPTHYMCAPPLPPWLDLRREMLLPELESLSVIARRLPRRLPSNTCPSHQGCRQIHPKIY